MNFIFQLSSYDASTLTPQVSLALQRRTELISRKQHPKLWSITDKLNEKKMPEAVLRKRRMRYRIYGVLLLGMGLFLLIPGLMEPEELFVPLVAGIFAVGLGIVALRSSRKKGASQFDQAAKKLLAGLQSTPPVQIRFTPEGMATPEQELLSYDRFEYVMETKDAVVLTWDEKVLVLQKRDMVEGDVGDFLCFMEDSSKVLSVE